MDESQISTTRLYCSESNKRNQILASVPLVGVLQQEPCRFEFEKRIKSYFHNMRKAFAGQVRALHSSRPCNAKVLVALYPDPVTGFPPNYARDDIPHIKVYPDGQTAPSPKAIDFVPGTKGLPASASASSCLFSLFFFCHSYAFLSL